jgi:hypothetical protein
MIFMAKNREIWFKGPNFESLENIKNIVSAGRNNCGEKFQAIKC